MKKILLLTSALTLMATSGCLVRDGGRGRADFRGEERHEHFEGHGGVIVEHPDVVVRPPEIIVR
jgi:hypothetical protein